jgi:hypothetical protein
MKDKPYYFETDENGVRVMVDKKTGKKTPVNDIVNRAAAEGRLKTMEQQMAEERAKKNIDTEIQ